MPPCCPCRVIASVRAAFVSFGFLTAVVLGDRGFQALEMADAQECHVCMSDLLDGSPVTSLACGHTFHDYFLNQISQVKLVAVSDGAFECPTCRVTNAQATALEVALAAAAPASGAAAASAPAPAPAAVPASAAAPPAAAKAPALPPPDAAAAWAYMESVGYASLVTTANLEAQQKALVAQKKALTKQTRLKKVRVERLMSTAAKTLTADQLLELSSKKAAAEKAKAVAKSKAKSKAKAKAKA